MKPVKSNVASSFILSARVRGSGWLIVVRVMLRPPLNARRIPVYNEENIIHISLTTSSSGKIRNVTITATSLCLNK